MANERADLIAATLDDVESRLERICYDLGSKRGMLDDELDADMQSGGHVHNWRTYVSRELAEVWPDLTRREKMVAVIVGEAAASSEEWD